MSIHFYRLFFTLQPKRCCIKQFLLIVACAFMFLISCKKETKREWLQINIPFYGDLLRVQYISNKTAYILGKNTEPGNRYNVLLKTQDGGISWSIKEFVEPEPGGVSELFVLNPNQIFTAFYAVYESNNEGESWNNFDSTQPINNPIRGLFFENNQNGVILKAEAIYRVSNGAFINAYNENSGTSLKKLKYTLDGILFATAGIPGSEGILLKSNDKGSTWQQIPFDHGFIEDITFLNQNIGFAFSSQNLFKTRDGGASLSKQNAELLPGRAGVIHFINENAGFFATPYGEIYHSTDSGRTWILEKKVENVHFTAITSNGENEVLVIGSNGTIFLNH